MEPRGSSCVSLHPDFFKSFLALYIPLIHLHVTGHHIYHLIMCAPTEVSIRPYHPQDVDQMKKLLRDGLLPLINVQIPLSFRLRWSTLSPFHPLLLAMPIFIYRQSIELYAAAVAVISLLYTAYYSIRSHHFFHGYVNQSLNSDMSNIDQVYAKPGVFLVATHQKRIVGMIAGESKGEGVFELRRMSVDCEFRGLGIAKRLLQGLEKELLQGGMMTKLFLETSSLQYAAQRVYQRYGFILEKKTNYPGAPIGFTLWRYCKTFEKEH